MRLSTRYRLNGFFHIVRGTVRGIVAGLGAKRTMAARGRLERIGGRLQGRIGKVHASVGL
jgi:hypothetical protein